MFRDGQYLEVIKASDNCLATAVVTVQEKTIEIRKKKVSTNKWLDLEDWAALYKILERAILRNSRADRCSQRHEKCEWRKSTRQLEVTYTIEESEETLKDTSLPTIRVNVSPARKRTEKYSSESLERSGKKEKNDSYEKTRVSTVQTIPENNHRDAVSKSSERDASRERGSSKKDKTRRYLRSEDLENGTLEEYVPDAPTAKKLCSDLKYVPSRKSALEGIQMSSNEYTPTLSDSKVAADVVRYVPNSVETTRTTYEAYEPRSTTSIDLPEEYVPNSKGVKASVEEYEPDFTSKSMKFDDSYVPSSVQFVGENSKRSTEVEGLKSQKHSSRRKGTVTTTTTRKKDLFA